MVLGNFVTLSNTTLLLEIVQNLRKSTLPLNCTHCKDIDNFMYHIQLKFLEDTPNQILHILITLILWLKSFYTTISQYPTLYNILAITKDELILWEYYLDNPNTCAKPKFF